MSPGIKMISLFIKSVEYIQRGWMFIIFEISTFTFKYHPNLCKQKAQITVRFNFRREFAQSFVDEIFMTFKDQNYFLNYICFIFIHLANKAFQITVKTPDVVHFEFLDLS